MWFMWTAYLAAIQYTNTRLSSAPSERASDQRSAYKPINKINKWLVLCFSLTPSPPWFPPLPDATAGASSMIAAAVTTMTTTTTIAAIRISMFTTLASAVFAVALVHASTLPLAQPNLRQRQSANSTIQWQPCANAPAPSECALFTYVFPHSPSPNQLANPLLLLIPTAFRSTMQNPPLEPPRSP
jgi:hypothetical protein